IQMLEEDGLLEDTIVIVIADHGRDMVRAKFALYDDGIHIPLVVRIPEKYQPEGYEAGGVCDEVVSGVDMMPSILATLGIDIPDDLPGVPFFGPDRSEREFAFAHRDRVGSHLDRSRAVVTKKYHYVRNFMPEQPGYWPASLYRDFEIAYDGILDQMLELRAEGKLTPEQEEVVAETRPAEELFDLENDPYTMHNIADDPEHLDALRQMRTALRRWIADTQDKGFIGEDPAEAAKGAWVVPLWLQLTGGTYNADDYDVFALPVDDAFRDMLR
ncbi:MAG: sulfatase-like hydrolase/transferase, partial [Acidimicrobiales bacterium]